MANSDRITFNVSPGNKSTLERLADRNDANATDMLNALIRLSAMLGRIGISDIIYRYDAGRDVYTEVLLPLSLDIAPQEANNSYIVTSAPEQPPQDELPADSSVGPV